MVDNEASVSSGGADTCMEVRRPFQALPHVQVPTTFFLLLELQVPMGAIWYHQVSPNENVAGSELVM